MPTVRPRRAAGAMIAAVVAFAGFAAIGASPAGAVTRTICFPVLDPVTYSETFGAPRDGGARSHEGEDLIGRKLHRLVAARDGVIVDLRGPGGNSTDYGIRIRDDEGWYFAYLHMNNDTPGTDDGAATVDQVFARGVAVGQRVRAGQFLGYMGDSGNAESTSPHLHFEMRQPAPTFWQSVAVSSYDSLRAASICAQPLSTPTQPFAPFGGTVTSDADAASSDPDTDTLDVVARGDDGAVWLRTKVGASLGGWQSLGGQVRSGPSIVSLGGSDLGVFARGMDDALWYRPRIGGTWESWEYLGGIITTDPDASNLGDGRVAVVAAGTDGSAWTRVLSGGVWGPWQGLGGIMVGGPGTTSPAPGALEVFIRGGDDRLWQRSMSADVWGGWAMVGGVLSASPDAASSAPGRLDVVVRGSDGLLYHSFRDGGWSGWSSVSTGPTRDGSGPSAVSVAAGRIDVLAVAGDRSVNQTRWTETTGW